MQDLVRTDDPVFLSWLTMRLEAEGIPAVVLDGHTHAALGGALTGVRARVMVDDDHIARARLILAEARAVDPLVPGPE